METYGLLKLIHILSSTLLFGTGLGTAYYMFCADKSGDLKAIAVVSKHVVMADLIFTTPAIIIQPLSGYFLMRTMGYGWSEAWIVASVGLYVLAGACWLPVVWLQIRMRNLANQAVDDGSSLPPCYRSYMRTWFILGWPAFLAVVIIFFLMIFKPT